MAGRDKTFKAISLYEEGGIDQGEENLVQHLQKGTGIIDTTSRAYMKKQQPRRMETESLVDDDGDDEEEEFDITDPRMI
eukprot:jgi/Bigna1/134883/aug1.27_g9591